MVIKSCVLIPSHICYTGQINLLLKTLDSLKHQLVDIFVSISFENDAYKEEFFTKIDNSFTIIVSKEQKYQMKHLFDLLCYANKYDLVFFCDDDDTYDPERIHIFSMIYEKYVTDTFGGIVEIIDVELNDAPEYWCYAIRPSLLNDFFDRFKNDLDLLDYDYGDMYFRNYLRLVDNITYCCCKFDKPLYNHLIHDNSVCARKYKDTNRYITNVIILMTICMYSNEAIKEKINTLLPESEILQNKEQLTTYVPNLDRINNFIHLLYDKIKK